MSIVRYARAGGAALLIVMLAGAASLGNAAHAA